MFLFYFFKYVFNVMDFIQELFITLYMIHFNSNKQYKWSSKFFYSFYHIQNFKITFY